MTTPPAALPSSHETSEPEVGPTAALEPRSGLGRRNAAIAPWIVLGLLAFSFLIGEALRGDLSAEEAAGGGIGILTASIAVAVIFLRSRDGVARDADPRLYAASAIGVTMALAGISIIDDGLASPYLTALVLGSGYLGLVLSARLSAALAAFMTGALVFVAVFGPPVTWLEAASLFVLVPSARFFGLLCGAAHRRAERVARQLTRADRLTRTLSRQGLLEELDHALVTLRRAHAPVALFLIDLDAFKEINSARGGAGGDELLAWCGKRLAEILPPGSSAGRLGGDEFGVATVGMNRIEADRFAVELRDALGERHPVSVGVATSEDSTVTVSDLLRVGNAALRRAKDDGERRIHGLVAGGLRPNHDHRPERPVLTYESLRRHGGRPRQPSPNVLVGTFLSYALFGLGLVGAVLSITIVTTDATPPSVWTSVIHYGWVPWVLASVATGVFARMYVDPMNTRDVSILIVLATILVGGGIAIIALAQGGGVVEPIMAGLALRVLFDTSVAFRPQAMLTLAGTLLFYLAVVALGPASSLWAAPFHLILIAGAAGLGQVAQRGFIETTAQWLLVARTDVLTGLRNRLGVEEKVGQILAACAPGERVAILSVDIDGMRAFNDVHGHPAGDAAIQQTAEVLTTTFSAALATGRLGADEFIAAVPVLSPSDADRLTATIESVLRPDVPASAGVAVYPDHGRDLDGLLHVADVRRRSAKASRREAAERQSAASERAAHTDRSAPAA